MQQLEGYDRILKTFLVTSVIYTLVVTGAPMKRDTCECANTGSLTPDQRRARALVDINNILCSNNTQDISCGEYLRYSNVIIEDRDLYLKPVQDGPFARAVTEAVYNCTNTDYDPSICELATAALNLQYTIIEVIVENNRRGSSSTLQKPNYFPAVRDDMDKLQTLCWASKYTKAIVYDCMP